MKRLSFGRGRKRLQDAWARLTNFEVIGKSFIMANYVDTYPTDQWVKDPIFG